MSPKVWSYKGIDDLQLLADSYMCMSDETDTRVSVIHVKKDDGRRKFGVSRLETRNFRNRNDELEAVLHNGKFTVC